MPDDPIYRFVVRLLCIPAAAFIVGILLYQLRLRSIWCFVLAEAATAIWYILSAPTNYFALPIWLFHIICLPVLLVPSLAGYYVQKYIRHHLPKGR